MSASLLYHGFAIRGYEYVRTDYHEGEVLFTIRQERKTLRCEHCGSRDVQPRGRVERRFRSLPIGKRSTAIVFGIPRVACQACEWGRGAGPTRGKKVAGMAVMGTTFFSILAS